jgi:SAM-dependent methyltransferase
MSDSGQDIQAPLGGTVSAVLGEAGQPSVLVTIANHGTGNDDYLQQVLAEYRRMPFRLELHVFTNVPKELGPDVKVHVGLPTRDARSLPFAHRRLFAEHVDRHDYFIYTEDDTLVHEDNLRAFMEVNAELRDDEIPGFLRVEYSDNGECIVECAHGPYRWIPSTVEQRGGAVFAAFSNHHSAFVMASRAHIRRALDSGGFLVAPHVARYGMLETAATDLYTQCGLKRLICASRLDDFLVHHLSNKYAARWGLRFDAFEAERMALEHLAGNGGWRGALFEVSTHVPRGRWSKDLYEKPGVDFLELVPRHARSLLSVGCGWGATEALLLGEGRKVTAVPVDVLFGDWVRRRGAEVIEGDLEQVAARLEVRKFDAVLLFNVLHLTPDPVHWLRTLRRLMNESGCLVLSVPRTCDPLRLIWTLRGEPGVAFPGPYARSGVQRVTLPHLRRWLAEAGFTIDDLRLLLTPKRRGLNHLLGGLAKNILASRFVLRAVAAPQGS